MLNPAREDDSRPVLTKLEPVLDDAANERVGVHPSLKFAWAVVAGIECPDSLQVRRNRRENDGLNEVFLIDQPTVRRHPDEIGKEIAAKSATIAARRSCRQADDLGA